MIGQRYKFTDFTFTLPQPQQFYYSIYSQMKVNQDNNHQKVVETKGKSSTPKQKEQVYVKFPILLFIMAAITSFGSFIIGYQMVCITMLERQIAAVNSLTQENTRFYLSLITSILPLGGMIGGYLVKYVDIVGENRIMMYTDYLTIISCLLSIHSLQIGQQCISRLFMGIACGLSSSIIPSYLVSISPISWSGFVASIHQIMITAGMAFSYFIGQKHQSISLGTYPTWKTFLAIPLVYSIVRVIILHIFRFDTLERHYIEGNQEKLKQYMRIFYNKVNIKELIKIKRLTKQIREAKEEEQQLYIFDIPKKAFNVGLALLVLSQLTSITSIEFYAKQLFMQITNFNEQQSNSYLLLIGVTQIFASIFGGWLSFKIQRKPIIINGGIAVAVTLFLGFLGYLFDAQSTIFLPFIITILIIIYSITIGTICFIYLAQTFQNIYVYTIIYWGLNLTSTLFFQVINNFFGTKSIFLFGCLFCILGVKYLQENLIESKEKTYRQVMNEYLSGDKDDGTVRDYAPVDLVVSQTGTALQ